MRDLESNGWITLLSLLFGFAGFLFGFWQHSTAARDRKELRAIRRRATAPLLTPSNRRFQHVYEDSGQEGIMTFWSASNGNVLSILRDEVAEEMAEGDLVILVIENQGEAAPRVLVKLDGQAIELIGEPDIDGAHGLHFLKYPFKPSLRGTEQRMELWFESAGVQDTHLYRTEHGRRVLCRVDPA